MDQFTLPTKFGNLPPRGTTSLGMKIAPFVFWGSHVSFFYKDKVESLDIHTSYFAAGLEANQYCVWYVSDPITEREASKLFCSSGLKKS